MYQQTSTNTQTFKLLPTDHCLHNELSSEGRFSAFV